MPAGEGKRYLSLLLLPWLPSLLFTCQNSHSGTSLSSGQQWDQASRCWICGSVEGQRGLVPEDISDLKATNMLPTFPNLPEQRLLSGDYGKPWCHPCGNGGGCTPSISSVCVYLLFLPTLSPLTFQQHENSSPSHEAGFPSAPLFRQKLVLVAVHSIQGTLG